MTDSQTIQVLFDRPFLGAQSPPCDDCGGDGYLLGDDDAARPCRCRDARVAAEYLRQARLPSETFRPAAHGLTIPEGISVAERAAYRAAQGVLRGAVDTAAKFAAKEYPETSVPFAALVGAAGSGKTWLLAAAIRRAAMTAVGAAYVSVADPFQAVSRFGDGDRDRGRARLLAVPLLAVDDVGGHRHETSSGLVRDLLLERIHGSMVTVIATRNGNADLTHEFGESIADVVRASSVALCHGSLRGR